MRTIPPELVQRYQAEGWWTDETLGEMLARGLAAAPEADFRVHSAVRPVVGRLRRRRIGRAQARGGPAGARGRSGRRGGLPAAELDGRGAVFWATSFLGATIVPVVHFYGRKELGYILRAVKPGVFIAAERFGAREFDPEPAADVPVVGVVGRDFDELLADEPLAGVAHADSWRCRIAVRLWPCSICRHPGTARRRAAECSCSAALVVPGLTPWIVGSSGQYVIR